MWGKDCWEKRGIGWIGEKVKRGKKDSENYLNFTS
jgi:hypothetical protein